QITSLDLSECTALASLDCYNNRLTSLNLSRNTALVYLSCDVNQLSLINLGENNVKLKHIQSSSNRLDAAALNAIFESLPSLGPVGATGTITISGNPGASTCNKDIVRNKNWKVMDEG
ncbi:MAG: hypothetical protein LBU80_03540, partial [Rikenellaceae bacterium]|nr:hypothetical protein [Rikenellaceae bacterium]